MKNLYYILLLLISAVFAGCAAQQSSQLTRRDPQALFAEQLKEYAKYQPFYDAVNLNSVEKLKAAFAANPIDIKTQIHPGGDLLYIAVRGTGAKADRVDREAIVKYLVEDKHADVNAKETQGFTPLHSITGLKTAKYLVEHGANVNVKNDAGDMPLATTLWLNNMELVKYLLDKGADINAKNTQGVSPIYTAALVSDPDIIELLIKRGADVNAHTNGSWSPITATAYYGKLEALKTLLKNGADIKDQTQNGWTPLLVAAGQGKSDIVAYLLTHGASLEETSNDGQKALYIAARYGRLDTVKTLLDAGADIDSLNFNAMTPLHVAVLMNQVDVAKYLIDSGANPNIKDSLGRTPMTLAVQQRKRSLIPILKSAEANYALVKGRLQEKRKLEKMKKDVDAFIAKDDLEGLKKYADQNPQSVNFVPNATLRLALTGPKGMKVGDIRQLINKGKSETLIISLIKRAHVPYKEFTLDEIDILSKMGISDNIISAMVDVTTKLNDEAKAKEEQEAFLEAQQNIAKQNAQPKVVYQNVPAQTQQQNNNGAMDKLQNELIKQGVSKLLDSLFR